MSKYAVGLALGVALVVGTVGLAQAPNPAVVAARKEVLVVAKAVEDGKGNKVIQAKVKAIKANKGIDLEDLMAVYKTHKKAGLGFGAKPTPDSGIEVKIAQLQRTVRGPSPEALKKEADDLIKLAYVTQAMAEITRPYVPNAKANKQWQKWLDDQKQASVDLIAAVKAANPKKVAAAAKKLLDSCTECHAAFRK